MELGAADAQESADQRAQIAVLSADELLLGSLRNAAPGLAMHSAASVSDLARLLGSHRCRALCVDLAAVTRGGLDLIPRLTALFPELPLVVIAGREDESAVETLLQRGAAERFLMKPISPHRARTMLTDAARQGHDNLVGPAPGLAPAPPPPRTPTTTEVAALAGAEARATRPSVRERVARLTPAGAAGLAAVLVLVAAITTVALLGDDPPPASAVRGSMLASPGTAATPRADASRAGGDAAELATLLAAGDLALARGALVVPIGASAMDYYRRAATLDPASRAARTGLAATADALLRDAEIALSGRRYPEAESAVRAASLAAPDEPRVTALLARIRDAQQRTPADARTSAASRRTALARRETSARGAAVAASPAGARGGDTLLASARPRAVAASGTAPVPASDGDAPATVGEAGAAPELPVPAIAEVALAGSPVIAGAPTTRAPDTLAPLQRISGNEPRYPVSARAAGVTGWVDLTFVVGASGVPQDVRVVRSEPARRFDDAARRAVQSWRYAPPGEPRPANIRVRFDLQ